MTEAQHEQHILAAANDHKIHLDLYLPDGEPTLILQVLHGLGEHAARYRRLADAAAAEGLALVVHNHRGHGRQADRRGHFADENGWQKLVEDVLAVNEFATERFPDLPVVLLGHSMGSFIAQSFAIHHGARLRGLILSGSTWPSRLQVISGWLLSRLISLRAGPTGVSALLDKIGFGDFNRNFEPARTEFDWLSRDEAEVDKYVADPLCGGPYTVGLWLDFLSGLIEISSDHALSRIPADLPILIMGGQDDPVGGEDGMSNLAMHYAQSHHQRLTVRIYPEGRHEMFNETNRKAVTADLLDWIRRSVRKP